MQNLISPATVAEMRALPDFEDMIAEYHAVAAFPGLPSPTIKWTYYEGMERLNRLHVLKATVGDALAGFASLVIPEIPRYDAVLGVVEGLFVREAYKASRAGLSLFRAVEAKAKELAVTSLLFNAPANGPLSEILKLRGYPLVNQVFLKSFP